MNEQSNDMLQSKKQSVFLVGAKSLGNYGGYETFVDKLTEYHQNNTSIEEPWIAARKGLSEDDAGRNLMDEEIISSYFSKVNEKYNLKKATGIEAYINHMRKEM